MADLVNGYLERGLGSLLFGATPDEVRRYFGEHPRRVNGPNEQGFTRWIFRRETGFTAKFKTISGVPRLVGLAATNRSVRIEGITLNTMTRESAIAKLRGRGIHMEDMHDPRDGELHVWFSRGLTVICPYDIVEECRWDLLSEDTRDEEIRWPTAVPNR